MRDGAIGSKNRKIISYHREIKGSLTYLDNTIPLKVVPLHGMKDFDASTTGYFCSLASKFLVQSSSLKFLAPELGNRTKHLDVVHISKFQFRRRSKAKVIAMNNIPKPLKLGFFLL